MRTLFDSSYCRVFVLVALWGLIMWLAAPYLGVQDIKITTTYGTVLWLVVVVIGTLLITHFSRPRA